MSKKVIFANKWIKLVEKELKVGDKNKRYYLVEKPDYVAIAPVFKGKILLISQKRYGVNKAIRNIPMGILENNEKPKVAAQRELLEESGIKVGKKDLISLGNFYIAPSFTPIKCYLFGIKCENDDISQISDDQEKHEFIKTEWVDMSKLKSASDIDMTTWLAIERMKNQ